MLVEYLLAFADYLAPAEPECLLRCFRLRFVEVLPGFLSAAREGEWWYNDARASKMS